MAKSIDQWTQEITIWRERKGFRTDWDNMPEKLMLLVSEAAEACEAHRIGDRGGFNQELADIAIRLLDICGAVGTDLESEIAEKMFINEGRPIRHGKAY